jgi:NAD(P)H-dependent FMN reductase
MTEPTPAPTPPTTLTVLAWCGSLRAASSNRALLRMAQRVAPVGMRVVPYAIETLPFYNADIEGDDAPGAVLAFRAALTAADAVLIATPEYNWSVPAVVKNALDWGSRPYGAHPLRGKPVAVISSAGRAGGARVQTHLDEMMRVLAARPVTEPALAVPMGATVLKPDGTAEDPTIEVALAERLAALAAAATEPADGTAGS